MLVLQRVHKWLSLLIGIQLLLWLVSGLMFSLLDSDEVRGHNKYREATIVSIDTGEALLNHSEIMAKYIDADVTEVMLHYLLERPVYRLVLADRVLLLDAISGLPVEITSTLAKLIVIQSYMGASALVQAPYKVMAPTMEARRHHGAVWRVDIANKNNTTWYVSGQDGQILERRNDSWRLFDFFWMLHIMDYQQRENFNNALVIFSAMTGVWLALSGLLLLFSRISWKIFTARIHAHRMYTIHLLDSNGVKQRKLLVSGGHSLFYTLSTHGVQLPSTCAGGGSCGLCQLQMPVDTAISTRDHSLISPFHLTQGYRLACQHRVDKDILVTLTSA